MTLQERFWSKVDSSGGPDACWPWLAGKIEEYGVFWLDGGMQVASRVAYRIATGCDPEELCVRHSCDNPPCCNPKHLLLGAHADNMADKVTRNRTSRLSGEANGNAKLTYENAAIIRSRYIEGSRIDGGRALARDFNVDPKTIRLVLNNETWTSEGLV